MSDPDDRLLSVLHMLVLSGASYNLYREYGKLCGAALKPVRHQPHVGVTSEYL